MKWDRSRSLLVVLLLLGLAATPGLGHAFGFAGAGGKVGYLTPEDGDGTTAVGAHMEFAEPGTRWHLMPGVQYWDESRMKGLNTNFDVYYHFGQDRKVTPYLGSGVGLSRIDPDGRGSNTDLAANLFGGARFPGRSNNFYIEGRQTLTEVPQTSLSAGITFK